MLLTTKNGFEFQIDEADQALISHLNWSYLRSKANSYVRSGNIYLHRFIMRPALGLVVDHINGDTLDNKRSNLRVCTRAENARNCHMKKEPKYKYRGVEYNSQMKRYRSSLWFEKKKIRSAWVRTALEAAILYDQTAEKYYGDFAILNFGAPKATTTSEGK
jgi:hypothetical protein